MAEQRKDKIFLAKLAEEMNRYEDMVGHMKDIIAMDSDDGLTVEERSLLSVAYKNVIGARRASWRVTYGLEQRYKSEAQESLANLASEYRQTIENELVTFCSEVLELLDTRLLPKAKTTEYKVFYLKMRGDCYRYQAEIVVAGGDRKEISDNAQKAYEEANEIAQKGLKATDPTRLGLTLNFSVFLYEILNQPQRACHIAQESFDLAMSELKENMNKDTTSGTYDDTTMILQSMRDNLILWQSQDSSDDDNQNAQKTEQKELKDSDKPEDTQETLQSASDKDKE